MQISPSFNGLLFKTPTEKNIREVKRKLEGYCITEGTDLGNGSFEVRGYKTKADNLSANQVLNQSHYTTAYAALQRLRNPSFIVNYSPKEGLTTEVRHPKYNDVFYKVTQKPGEEPQLDESVLTIKKEPEAIEKIKQGFYEIKGAIGKYIPTLKDIKF